MERNSDSEAGTAQNIISDDDDDSYVPDSLRDFFKQADKQLEADLSFLSPPGPSNVLYEKGADDVVLGGYIKDEDDNNDKGDDDDKSMLSEEFDSKNNDDDDAEADFDHRDAFFISDNDLDLEMEMEMARTTHLGKSFSSMKQDNSMPTDDEENLNLESEMEIEMAREKEKERASAMKEESEDRKERERKQVDQHKLQSERKQKQRKLEETRQAAKLEAAKALEDEDYDDDDDVKISSPLLDIVNPSADVSESHVKRIAMEGADHMEEQEEEALQPLVPMATTPHLPSPTIDSGMAELAKRGKGFSPSPAKVGRKLQMELDAEAHRASLQTPNSTNKKNNENNKSIDRSIGSAKVALKEKQKSIREKQERLKQLESRSVERKRRLQTLDAKVATEQDNMKVGLGKTPESPLRQDVRLVRPQELQLEQSPEVTPSIAAAAAANTAAVVVDKKTAAAAAAVNNKNTTTNDAIAVPNTSPKPKSKKAPNPRKVDLAGPVKSLPTKQRQRSNRQPAPNQKWSFRARNAPSPPRPREIITRVIVEDGRSVSPLGHMQAVSPLASPRQTPSYRRPVRNYDKDKNTDIGIGTNNNKPLRSSPSKRRQLTQPSSAFDRLSRPTVASSAGHAGEIRKLRTNINPEEEQRKARERVRKRMAVQRKAITSNNEGGKDDATKKANARKKRIEKMEQERLAKIKAKIAEREGRMKTKKKEEAKTNKRKVKQKTAALPQPSKTGLTIPVAPKFATDQRLTSISRKAPPKERLSLASSTSMFGKGLRSSTPPIKRPTATPRLTIPMAPKFATSRRLGDKQHVKSTPFSSPTRKRRESMDNVSWSSQLRDVSAIGSPLSKAANSVKTGPLTIPITPQFQPIRKRQLPKSTAEREEEEMEYFEDHPFKARMVEMHQPLTASRAQKSTPKRKLTIPEPFHFHKSSSTHRRGILENKEEGKVTSFKASPMPDLCSKKITGIKKTPGQTRPLTTPEPFRFHSTTSSKRIHMKSETEPTGEKFKALPMPDFKKSNRTSLGSSKLTSPRTITTPEPFQFNSSSSKRDYVKSKSEEEMAETKFKALPMPEFKKPSRPSIGNKKLKSPPNRSLTIPEPFSFNQHSSNRKRGKIKNDEAEKTFKARPMPKFSKTPLVQQKAKEKSKRSNKIPTGASGLLFHRSVTGSSRLSRPRIAKEPSKQEYKPFKARPMPDFIPDVIVTRTPIKDQGGEQDDQDRHPYELEQDLDFELEGIESNVSKFQARPMPDFEKIDIAVKDKLLHRIRTPSPKEKEITPTAFKASPAPKNMLDDPIIPVRRRDPKKLRSPDSVQRPTLDSTEPKASTFKALPIPDSLYDEPAPIRRSPISKIKSPDRSKPSPSRKKHFGSPMASPPRIYRGGDIISSSNVMEDAKARLRERLSKRRSNSAAVKAVTPNRDKAKANKDTTPKAFSTLHVQSRLNSQANAKMEQLFMRKDSTENPKMGTENTPRKSNSTIPKSIDLPVRSSSIPNAAETSITPKVSNNNREGSPSSFHTAEGEESNLKNNAAKLDKEAALLKETKLALALGMPDGDESSSILQLARDVQRAAEDELSFYGSVDTRDHWTSSLADGKPHSLLG